MFEIAAGKHRGRPLRGHYCGRSFNRPDFTLGDRVDNITVVRGEKTGFPAKLQCGRDAARGRYILFLNNDTYVCSRLAGAAGRYPESDASVGIVGPRLLFEDGRLQEAGAIMWRDGSAWNFGRMDDPDKPEYNYRREVDYVSGACLLVRAQLWQQLAGFDERYVPAYRRLGPRFRRPRCRLQR